MPKTLEPTEKAPEYLSIGDAAERTGLTQRTLRYWEDLGLLKPPARVAGGQRLYSREDIARIEQIVRMKKLLGFSLGEIKTVVDAEEAKLHLREDIRAERSARRRLKQLREAAEITASQLQMVDEKIAQMRAMRKELARDLTVLNERIAQIEEHSQEAK